MTIRKKWVNWTAQGDEQIRRERSRRALRRLPIFVVATVPFGLIAFSVFDAFSAALFMIVDVIFVTLAIEQAD